MTRVRTSWFSSRRSIVPRYPNRLSANRGDARSLTHSICPKCVRSPRVNRYLRVSLFYFLIQRTGWGGRHSSLRTFCCLTFPLGSSRKLVRMAADSFCITAPINTVNTHSNRTRILRSSAIVFAALTDLMKDLRVLIVQRRGRWGKPDTSQPTVILNPSGRVFVQGLGRNDSHTSTTRLFQDQRTSTFANSQKKGFLNPNPTNKGTLGHS